MKGWDFAVNHMPAVRSALCTCPAGMFMDFQTATPKQDMEQATDLVMDISGGTLAVRVRSRKFWDSAMKFGGLPDWAVRCYCRGCRTEIHKLRDGFADWYFFGWSGDNMGSLVAWVVLDLNVIREQHILDQDWQSHKNGDGTAGMYIPLQVLKDRGCIIRHEGPFNFAMQTALEF